MKSVISAILAICCAFPVWAETTLWKVSKGDTHVYLGGTIHLLAPEDLPFPKAFDQAFESSEKVVLETDMQKLLDPQTQLMLMSQLSYQDGRLLNQQISSQLYSELNQYLKDRQLMPNMFIGMKPAGVMLTMLAIEFQRLGISESGADTYYYKQAVATGRKVAGLESIEQHMSFIAELGEGNEERFLRQTLDDMAKTETMMRSMVRYWKTGDVAGLEREVVNDMKVNYPRVYRSLLVERNERWFPQIQSMLKSPEIELVLVGAAHLIGPDGILKMLRDQGYKIEQL